MAAMLEVKEASCGGLSCDDLGGVPGSLPLGPAVRYCRNRCCKSPAKQDHGSWHHCIHLI